MREIKLISLDLDGTLLDSGRNIPQENINILEEAEKKGKIICISTGSPLDLMPHSLLRDINISYAITANGSAVYDYKTRECIFENSIPIKHGEQIIDYLSDKNVHTDFFIGGKGYVPIQCRGIIDKLNVTEARKEYLRNHRIWMDSFFDLKGELDKGLQKITLNFFPDEDGKLVDYDTINRDFFLDKQLQVTTGVKDNMEITRTGVDKGKALTRLLEKIGIEKQDVIAFGDAKNDISIIKMAGIGVAMDNAMEELKACADEITLSNDACGVAWELKKYL